MREFKYIIFDDVFPVVFSLGTSHNEVHIRGRATSAGFATLHIGEITRTLTIETYGKSESMKLQPAEHDANILRQLFVDPFYDKE
jgi:hypothetical protein